MRRESEFYLSPRASSNTRHGRKFKALSVKREISRSANDAVQTDRQILLARLNFRIATCVLNFKTHGMKF